MTSPYSTPVPERGSIRNLLAENPQSEGTLPVEPDEISLLGSNRAIGLPTSRITVLSQVYFQSPHSEARLFDTRLVKPLEGEEAPLEAHFTLTKDWKKIELSYLTSMSLFLVVHKPERFAVQPTEKELEVSKSQVIEIGITSGESKSPTEFALVQAGGFHPITPIPHRSYWLRAVPGPCRCQLVLFPA